jgi:hypothetical protein
MILGSRYVDRWVDCYQDRAQEVLRMPRLVDGLAELGTETRAETVQINARVPKEVHDALRVLMAATGQTSNDIVLRALMNYLATDGHRAAVRAFADRATEQYALALDKLKDL